MLKLNQKLTNKQFILSHIVILIVSLIFLFGLYYILNIQYQKPTKPFAQGPVTSPPKSLILALDQPDDWVLTFEPSIIISGKTGPNLDILISTESQDLVIRSKSDGKFSTILNLSEGVNDIKAVVFDQTGDTRVQERTVYFSKEKL